MRHWSSSSWVICLVGIGLQPGCRSTHTRSHTGALGEPPEPHCVTRARCISWRDPWDPVVPKHQRLCSVGRNSVLAHAQSFRWLRPTNPSCNGWHYWLALQAQQEAGKQEHHRAHCLPKTTEADTIRGSDSSRTSLSSMLFWRSPKLRWTAMRQEEPIGLAKLHLSGLGMMQECRWTASQIPENLDLPSAKALLPK